MKIHLHKAINLRLHSSSIYVNRGFGLRSEWSFNFGKQDTAQRLVRKQQFQERGAREACIQFCSMESSKLYSNDVYWPKSLLWILHPESQYIWWNKWYLQSFDALLIDSCKIFPSLQGLAYLIDLDVHSTECLMYTYSQTSATYGGISMASTMWEDPP